MERQRVWLVVLVLLTPGAVVGSEQRDRGAAPRQGDLRVTGEVVQIHAPRVFTIRETAGAERELLVLAPRALAPGFVGATVTVEDTLRRFTDAELRSAPGLRDVDPETRQRLVGRTVLAARSVMAYARGEAKPPAATPAPAPAMEEPRPISRRVVEDKPLTVRTAMLVANVDLFAGRQVRLLHGRVVGVLEPGALLIEPATSYMKTMGQRDRVLVLIGPAALRATPELIVGSTVTVTGTARTLVGIQVTRETPWPSRLRPEVVERLEVRAAVLATSVQTPDGVELTDRPPAAQR